MHKVIIGLIISAALFTNCKKESAKEQDITQTNVNEVTTNADKAVETASLESNGERLGLTENPIGNTNPALENSVPLSIEKPSGIQQTNSGNYDFSYNLAKGKSYPMTIKRNVKTSISDGKQSATNREVATLKRTYTVTSIKPNGNYVMQVKQGRTEKSITVNGETITLSSSKKPSQKPLLMQWKMLQAEMQTPLTIEMTPVGKIVSIDGTAKLRSALKTKLKGDMSAEEFKAFEKGLEAGYSEKSKILELEQNLAIFPTKPIPVGKEITEKDNQADGGNSLNVTSSIKLEKVTPQSATLKTNSTSTAKGSQSKDGFSVSSNGTQNSSGTIVFNKETGWVQSATLRQKQTTKETQKYKGESASGTQTVETTVTVN